MRIDLETVTASEAAQLLGVDRTTLRRRLARDYRGVDRIKGAVRRGRDWRIPRSEVDRLIALDAKETERTIDARVAIRLAKYAWDELRTEAWERLLAAALCIGAADNAGPDQCADALRELEAAVQEFREVGFGGQAMLKEMIGHIKDKDFLAEMGQ
jgi:hypothetical protein